MRVIRPARPWSCDPSAVPRRGTAPFPDGSSAAFDPWRPLRARDLRPPSVSDDRSAWTSPAFPRTKATFWTHVRDLWSQAATAGSTRSCFKHAQGHRDRSATRPRGVEQSCWTDLGSQDTSCESTSHSSQTSRTREAKHAEQASGSSRARTAHPTTHLQTQEAGDLLVELGYRKKDKERDPCRPWNFGRRHANSRAIRDTSGSPVH